MSKGMTTLVLRQVDGFDIEVEAELVDNKVCGGYDGFFTMEVELSVYELDANGFVTDNHEFINAVRTKFEEGTYKASCEELAQGIARLAHDRIGPRLVKAIVRVYNRTGFAVYKWEQGNDLPVFPRKATKKEIRETGDREPRGC